MVRSDGGKSRGTRVATALYRYATPTPMAIRVNMLGLRNFTDAQPRWKNGQPHHNTIGVARRNSIALPSAGETSRSAGPMRSMAKATRGMPSATLHQKRRVMSRSSGFSSSAAVTVRGSSAMPQIGQKPGSVAHDLRMHGAGPLGAGGRDRRIGLQRHAALRTGTGFDSRTSGHMGHTYNVAGEVAAGAVLAGAIVVSCAAAVPFARYFSGSA